MENINEQLKPVESMKELIVFLNSSELEERRQRGKLLEEQIQTGINSIDRKLFMKAMKDVDVDVPEDRVEYFLKKMLEKESDIKLPKGGNIFS